MVTIPDSTLDLVPEHPAGRSAGREVLIGRTRELAEMAQFFGVAVQNGGGLLLSGERGVGKSTLVDEASRRAEETWSAQVVRTRGFEAEAGVKFAALHQLMLPFVHTLAQVPEPYRSILASTLGLDAGCTPGRIRLATALLAWFRQLAEVAPLIVVVDDWPGVDRASRRILGMVARRLDATRTAMVITRRAGSTTPLDTSRMRVLELSPLSEQDSLSVLQPLQLDSAVRQRIATVAAGNPLALAELPRALSSAQRAGVQLIPAAMPLTDRLRDVFADRLDNLPESTRELLVLAALNGVADVPLEVLVRDRADDVRRAEESGAVWVDVREHSLRFRHLLTRWAVIELASAPQRRAAHAVLAALSTGAHQRILHRADAALDVDVSTADALVAVAGASLDGGHVERAIAVLSRAAELTSDPDFASRRLSEAAYLAAQLSGAPARAEWILGRAEGFDHSTVGSLEAVTARASILAARGVDIDAAADVLVKALEVCADESDPRAVEAAVTTLSFISSLADEGARWRVLHEVVLRHAARLPRALVIGATTLGDPARATPAQLREIDSMIERADSRADVDPVRAMQIVDAAVRVDRLPRDLAERVVKRSRSGGAAALEAACLLRLASDAFLDGRWQDSERLTQEGLDLCDDRGLALRDAVRNQQLLLRAVRGDRAVLDQTRSLPRSHAAVVDALLAMAEGRHHDALDAFGVVGVPGEFPPFEPAAVWTVFDVVEACARSGRMADGRRHLDAARDLGLPAMSARMRFLCDAAGALLESDDRYIQSFERLLETNPSRRWPFHLARVELAYGERLRHDREIRRAREHLNDARELFSALDARTWENRAAAELRATGQRRNVEPHLRVVLTPQEEEVALLAASGLTNKQIGERLFLSARTVSGHLYRIFPKLGIATRAALRDALSEREQELS
ncbi:AAA family ATPase [Herbiconiux sp. CPCC 205763]|uniref:AAA family ATPase n=1 Tax=Herbiconiux aconitum TaxID=2970913 RepID=A0ABT2GYF1_9MICO|nr:AAA family ATPase [Herbiconiux aconitum]MCS5720330.1 AAA family ATPase [Herbiconiux aconitum]